MVKRKNKGLGVIHAQFRNVENAISKMTFAMNAKIRSFCITIHALISAQKELTKTTQESA
jgi:hypothetical protein